MKAMKTCEIFGSVFVSIDLSRDCCFSVDHWAFIRVLFAVLSTPGCYDESLYAPEEPFLVMHVWWYASACGTKCAASTSNVYLFRSLSFTEDNKHSMISEDNSEQRDFSVVAVGPCPECAPARGCREDMARATDSALGCERQLPGVPPAGHDHRQPF